MKCPKRDDRVAGKERDMSDDLQYMTMNCPECSKQITTQINKTLRDQFAMAALQGILSSSNRFMPEHHVKNAYEYADAMLKARSKP
jgi:hypothetical protein